MYAYICVFIYKCGRLSPLHVFSIEYDPFLEIDFCSSQVSRVKQGTLTLPKIPGSTSFSRSS